MTGPGLRQAIADAREVRRLARIEREIGARHAPRRPRSGHVAVLVWLAGPPMLVPLFVLFGINDSKARLLTSALACLFVLAFGGHTVLPALARFSATDVLRMPSKAGVFLARLVSALPALLWSGACWAIAIALGHPNLLKSAPLAGSALLLAVVLVPVLWTVGRVHGALTIGKDSFVGPLLVGVLGAGGLWHSVRHAESGNRTCDGRSVHDSQRAHILTGDPRLQVLARE